MKRFLSILLAVAMTISMVLPVFAGSYTDTVGNDYEAAIEHLSGLGVINGYEDGSYQPEKVVTRAEMAKLMIVCLGLADGADLLAGESAFDDVASNHWAVGYINVATQYGIIKGDGDGNFRPDDTVNYAETVTMALRALGYSSVVEKAGQWPTNYINKANELKLFEDVENFKVSDGAKRGSVAQILWNMVGTEMWTVVSESEGNGLTSTKDKTMLETKFPDFTHKVGANAVANYVDEQNIVAIDIIDNDTVKVTFAGPIAIYVDNVSPLSLIAGAKYSVLYVEDKVEGVAGKVNVAKSFYRDTEDFVFGKVEKATADEVTIDGVKYKEATAAVLNAALEGKIVVIELDAAGKAVACDVFATANEILVKEVKESKDGKTVKFTKNTADGNADITVNLDNKDIMFVKYTADGTTELVDRADVKAGMILEEYTDASIVDLGTFTKVYVVVDEAITGKVDKVEVKSATNYTLTINGEKYDITTSDIALFEGKKEVVKLTADQIKGLIGQTITAKVSADGSIKYVEAKDEKAINNYAIINTVWTDTDEGVTIQKVKVVDLNGVEKTLNVKIGSEIAKVAKAGAVQFIDTDLDGVIDAGEQILTGTVIDYTVSDNEITAIAYKAFEAITKINKTAGIITVTSGDVAYDSSSKLVKYTKETINSKDVYKVTNFEMTQITEGAAKNYVVIKDAVTNVAEYVIYNAQTAVSADKVYGVVVATSYEVRMENDTYVWAIDVKDVITGEVKAYETNKGAAAAVALGKGAVVQVSEKADGFYQVAAFANAVGSTGKNARTLVANAAPVQYGANYTVTDGVDTILFKDDAEIIFIENNETTDKYGREDIVAGKTIYAFEDVDDTTGELYTYIIVK